MGIPARFTQLPIPARKVSLDGQRAFTPTDFRTPTPSVSTGRTSSATTRRRHNYQCPGAPKWTPPSSSSSFSGIDKRRRGRQVFEYLDENAGVRTPSMLPYKKRRVCLGHSEDSAFEYTVPELVGHRDEDQSAPNIASSVPLTTKNLEHHDRLYPSTVKDDVASASTNDLYPGGTTTSAASNNEDDNLSYCLNDQIKADLASTEQILNGMSIPGLRYVLEGLGVDIDPLLAKMHQTMVRWIVMELQGRAADTAEDGRSSFIRHEHTKILADARHFASQAADQQRRHDTLVRIIDIDDIDEDLDDLEYWLSDDTITFSFEEGEEGDDDDFDMFIH